MSNKRKLKKQVQRQSSSLKDHKQIKKTLLPPLAQIMNLTPMHWNPDMIPEMLLIDAVVELLTWKSAPSVLHKILDVLDGFVVPDPMNTLLGTISSMALVSEEQRDEARRVLDENGFLNILLPDELRHGLALYPQCPASWLLDDWREGQSIDWEQGTRYLKGAVQRLWDSKSVYATRCRMLPLARMIKHGRIKFTADIKSIELFPRYPTDLTEDEQRQVESSSRAMFNTLYNIPGDSNPKEWPAYFWRHNYQISSCEQIDDDVIGEIVGEDEMQQVQHEIRRVSQGFRDTIQRATAQAKLDIYDLDRDEIIFGVLSRQCRLYNVLATNPSIWTADLGSMFHRVMVDALITLKWIIQQNKPELYRKFKEFSLGKQKLLKLHVEELVDQGRDDLAPYEEYLAASVNDEIWEEFLSVDLGSNFAGLDTRKMAQEVGLRDTYNLVYSPGSSELHGEWTSLKQFNLVRCGNPLHRFHRLPRLSTPSILAPYAVLVAANLLIDTFKVYLEAYQLQQFSNEADSFPAQLEEIFANL